MVRNIKFYISFLITLLWLGSLSSQSAIVDLLDKLSIGAITKDHYGRIWLGANSGLYCYDGSQLIEINKVSGNKLFVDAEINGIKFDQNVKKLIITTKKGLIYFDPENFEGVLLGADKLKLKHLKKGLWFPCIDEAGNIWCTNNEMALIKIDRSLNAEVININIPIDPKILFSYGNFTEFSCMSCSKEKIFFGTQRSEVCEYDIKKGQASALSINHRAISGIYSIEADLICSDFSGIHLINKTDTSSTPSIPAHLISFLYLDSQKEVWYVLNKTQVFKLNEYKQPELVYELSAEQVNKHKSIRAILVDGEKIWLATERGLLLLNKPLKAFYKIFDKLPGYSNVELSSRGITSKDDSTIICAGYNYLASYEHRSNKIKTLVPKETAKNLIPYGLCITGDSLWIASEGSGLRLFDLANLKLKKVEYTNKILPQYFVNGGLIKCVTKVDSFICLGEYGTFGLYNLRTKQITDSYSAEWKYKWAREKTNGINQILQLSPEELLFVARGSIVLTNKQFRVINKIDSKDLYGSLSEFSVLNVMLDQQKHLWISTDKSGLCFYNSKTQKCKWFNTQNGLCDNTVYYSLQSNDGRIWVATNYGLSVIDPATGVINNYYEKDGLANNEFNTNSFFKAANGDLYLGGMKGVTRVKPSLLVDRLENERFMITAVHIAGALGPDSVIQTNLATLKQVTLPNQSRFLKVQFSLINFSNNNKYAFRLIGSDSLWVNLGNSNSVVFNSLSPGSYTLQIKAWNEHGDQAQEMISLPIVSEQIFYKKPWFIAFMLALFAGVIGAIFYVIYKLKLRAIHQMAEMRLKIAADLHDQVGGLLNKTASQAELVKVNSAQDSTTLNKIADNSRVALNSMRDILWNLDPRNDNPESLVNRMSEYAHKMLEDSNSYELNLGDLKKVELTHEQRQIINTVFAEAINNIVKHAPNQKVDVKATASSKGIELMIVNSGKFIGKDVNSGQGIKNMKMRIEKIGGSFSMDVKDNVKVVFWLPLRGN